MQHMHHVVPLLVLLLLFPLLQCLPGCYAQMALLMQHLMSSTASHPS
jgi:hypothetical protein